MYMEATRFKGKVAGSVCVCVGGGACVCKCVCVCQCQCVCGPHFKPMLARKGFEVRWLTYITVQLKKIDDSWNKDVSGLPVAQPSIRPASPGIRNSVLRQSHGVASTRTDLIKCNSRAYWVYFREVVELFKRHSSRGHNELPCDTRAALPEFLASAFFCCGGYHEGEGAGGERRVRKNCLCGDGVFCVPLEKSNNFKGANIQV